MTEADDIMADTFILETYETELLWVVECREHRSSPMSLADAIRLQANWTYGLELSRGWVGKCRRKHLITRIWVRRYSDGTVAYSWDKSIFPLAPAAQKRDFKFGALEIKESARQKRLRLIRELGKRNGTGDKDE